MKNLKIIKECDVLVVGGGPAGCSAAVSSARAGVSTLLIEQTGMLGGATVNQDVVVVLSQNAADFEGIWHEYMARLFELGGAYKDDFSIQPLFVKGVIDPNIVRLVWDRLLQESGADLILHCNLVDVIKNGNLIDGVIVNTRQGLGIIKAKTVIDCTGDAMVCNAAEAEWEQGSEKSECAMSLTKVMRLGGIEENAGLKSLDDKKELENKLQEEVSKGIYKTGIMTSGRVLHYINTELMWYLKRRKELMLVTSRVLNANPTSFEDITRAEREGLNSMYEVYDFYKKYVPGCENAFIAHISNQIGVRSSRRVHGMYYISDEDVLNFKKHPESVAKASWQIDVWPSDSYTAPAGNAGGIKDEKILNEYKEEIMRGGYFDIPYGAIVVKGFDNLLMAGRIISASHLAEASVRIQQTCMSTGQAAGYAAAKAVKENTLPSELDGNILSKELKEIRKNTPVSWDKFTVEYSTANCMKN